MNINDASVLELINGIIASYRLNKIQTIQLVDLASVSSSVNELKENMKWEMFKSNH